MNYLKRALCFLRLTNYLETSDDYKNPPFSTLKNNKPIVRILGDHSKLHCGCQAVMETLKEQSQKKNWKIARCYQKYNILIVNGEGSMHHNSNHFVNKMQILQKAVDFGIPAYLVNTVWEENTNEYDSVLKRLAGISTREILSQKELENKHGIQSKYTIDASFFANIDTKSDFTNYNGQPVKTDFYDPYTSKWTTLSDNFVNVPYISMTKNSWSSFVLSLKTSKYLITGRHHAVYAACKARIPFAASESNTHKISGLIKTAGVNIPIAQSPHELPNIISQIDQLKEEYEKLFNWMDKQVATDIIPT